MDLKNTYCISMEPSVKSCYTANDIFKILQCISEKDRYILGINSPENMIYTQLPIPPLCIRPSLRGDKFSIGFAENNLTTKISDIIKWNNKYVKSLKTF